MASSAVPSAGDRLSGEDILSQTVKYPSTQGILVPGLLVHFFC